MAVDYDHMAAPASEADIARLQQRIGHELPAQYRAYLLRQDGGRLTDNNEALDEVFGLSAQTPDFASMWRILDVYAGRIPDWLLPVGQDVYGNVFAISLREQDPGAVWFWDHEEEAAEGEPPSEANLTFKAADWDSFLNGLRPVA